MPVLVLVVLHRHRALQVNDRQQHEDERLQPPVTSPRNIIGSGTRNGTMLNRMRMTSSSPKMLPNSRSESDITRDEWLMISIGEHQRRHPQRRARRHRRSA